MTPFGGGTAAVARGDVEHRIDQRPAPIALAFGGSNLTGGVRSSPVCGLSVCSRPPLEIGVDVLCCRREPPARRAGGGAARRHGGAERRRARDRRHRAGAGACVPARGRQRVQMPLPEHLVEVVVDRIDVVRAAADEGERLESLMRNDVRQQHRLRQRLELPRLILELRLPEQLKARLLQALLRDPRVGLDPRRPLRIARRSSSSSDPPRPCARAARGGRNARGRSTGAIARTASSHHASSFVFIAVRAPAAMACSASGAIDLVAGIVGQQAVTRQRHAEIPPLRQRGVVVQIDRAAPGRVVP